MSQTRQERRATERQNRKDLRKQMAAGATPTAPHEQPATAERDNDPSEQQEDNRAAEIDARMYAYYLSKRDEWAAARAARNRANAEHSTGPRTEEGKANSSRNSFKHGLYAKDRYMTEEDHEYYDQMKAIFTHEYRPAPGSEALLVKQMVEHVVRLKRLQTMESNIWLTGEDVSISHLNALHRFINSADRGFHRSLKALRQMQKERAKEGCQHAGRPAPERTESRAATAAAAPVSGTTAVNSAAPAAKSGFVPQNTNQPPQIDIKGPKSSGKSTLNDVLFPASSRTSGDQAA